ncbi:MAG: Ku protein [Candidatus Borkfalkia sp.]
MKYKKTCADWTGAKSDRKILSRATSTKKVNTCSSTKRFRKTEIEKDKNITIEQFVNLAEIDRCISTTYYVAPTGAEKAFAVLLSAMEEEGKAAVAKTVLGTKETLIAIRAKDGQMLLNTLFFAEEVTKNPAKEIKNEASEAEIEDGEDHHREHDGQVRARKYKDEYREKVLAAIEQKISGKEINSPRKEAGQSHRPDGRIAKEPPCGEKARGEKGGACQKNSAQKEQSAVND